MHPGTAPSEPGSGFGVIDAGLLSATPLSAREVLYTGDDFERFAARYLSRNTKAALHRPEAAPLDPDVAVLASCADLDAFLAQGVRLHQSGALVVRIGLNPGDDRRRRLGAAGFQIVKEVRDGNGLAWVAVPESAPAALLHVELWAFAPTLMDVRTRLPTEQLGSDPRVTARWSAAPFQLPDLALGTPKIVISQRPGRYPEAALRSWLAETLAKGWLPILETDDHPGVIARVEGREVDELDWLKARAMLAVQTSTPRLAEVFAPHNPEIRVFPNAVFELPPFPDGDRPRRVFYGAISRGPFAVDVAKSLAPVVRQFPDVEFVVVGDRAVFDAIPTSRKRYEDYLPYDRYLALMRTCSVTLSPLAGRPYEDTKSDAKFLDAAQSGAVLIASPAVYGEAVRHGVNGLIARRRDHWAPLLADVLRHEPKRRQMAQQAWEYVRTQRMFADQVAERRDWYLDLWARRRELEAALCERLPGLADAVARLRA